MGVSENFQTFCNNLKITNRDDISARYKAITKRLNLDYWSSDSDTYRSIYVGSYGRGTAIKGISDIDMLFKLPYDVYERFNNHIGNGQSALLQEVKNVIKKTYSSTDVGGDGQVVVVSFSDGMKFEVLPAFINKDNKSYTFPDSNDGGKWRVTDPQSEIDTIQTRDNVCNNNLKWLARMMRAWKGKWDVPIKGLLIDTLSYSFIGSWENRDKSFVYYDWMVRDFFNYMSNQDENKLYWLAPGSSRYVWKEGNFQYKAKRCYNISLEAIDYDSRDMPYSAGNKWREIFGSAYTA